MSLFLQTLVLRGILSGEQEHRLEEFHMKKILTRYGVSQRSNPKSRSDREMAYE